MERMEESSPSQIEYIRYQQFITDSPWSAEDVIAHVRSDVSKMIQSYQSQCDRSRSTGLLLDESGHRKSGTHSVGVARQYLGNLGEVDNGQVGVYASLISDGVGSLVDQRLYLPKGWTQNKRRCQQAGIPGKGRKPTRLRSDQATTRVDTYARSLDEQD